MRLSAIGEAMGELRPSASGALALGIAGDVFNTLAYVRALGGSSCELGFVSGAGSDPVSAQLLARCRELCIRPLFEPVHDASLGLYMIATDADGERSFSYWRSASPARDLVNSLTLDARAALARPGLILLSGITLAILDETQRGLLAELLEDCRNQGARIAFDPNYRAALWSNVAQARRWVERFYRISDIALPGLEDEQALFDRTTPEATLDQPALANAGEVVLKAGRAGVRARVGTEFFTAPFVAPAQTVDTTAAGDSFNAAWLVARHAGIDPSEAARFAARTAAAVAGCAGAIVPFDVLPALPGHQETPP